MRTSKQIRRDTKHLLRCCLVDGVLDENRVRWVVRRLVQSRRRDRFALLARFHRLVGLEDARHAATVESAVVLPGDLLARLQSDLIRTYGPGLRISVMERPTLIGGIRVRVGSDVYDGSIQAKLAVLENRL